MSKAYIASGFSHWMMMCQNFFNASYWFTVLPNLAYWSLTLTGETRRFIGIVIVLSLQWIKCYHFPIFIAEKFNTLFKKLGTGQTWVCQSPLQYNILQTVGKVCVFFMKVSSLWLWTTTASFPVCMQNCRDMLDLTKSFQNL